MMDAALKSMRHRYGVVNQYRMLNECLDLVNKSRIETVRRLTIETKLIRMKKLLLDRGTPSTIRCRSCGDDVIASLLGEMRAISSGAGPCDEAAVEGFADRLRGILVQFGGGHSSSDTR